MINFFSKWIEGIAIAVIIASIFEMLIPNGNIKKFVKMILGLYVVFSIIAPFVDSKKLYSIDVSEIIQNYENLQDVSNNTEQSKEDLEKIYKETLEKEIRQAVEKQGYNVHKCTVQATFDTENKNAGVNKIQIILDSKKQEIDETDTQIQEKEERREGEESNNSILIQNIQDVKKVEINVGDKTIVNKLSKEITFQDINDLKKYLSEHYELDKKILDIQKR